MIQKSISVVLGLLLLGFSGSGLFHAMTAPTPGASRVPEAVLFAGFALTAAIWLFLTFRPSRAGKWLLCACAVGAIWLHALTFLATRDDQGLAGVSLNEWARMAFGVVVLGVLLVLAARARRSNQSSAAGP